MHECTRIGKDAQWGGAPGLICGQPDEAETKDVRSRGKVRGTSWEAGALFENN